MLSETRASAIAEAIRNGELSRIDPKDQLCAQSFKDVLCGKLDQATAADISSAWQQAEIDGRTWLEQEEIRTIGWAIRLACA